MNRAIRYTPLSTTDSSEVTTWTRDLDVYSWRHCRCVDAERTAFTHWWEHHLLRQRRYCSCSHRSNNCSARPWTGRRTRSSTCIWCSAESCAASGTIYSHLVQLRRQELRQTIHQWGQSAVRPGEQQEKNCKTFQLRALKMSVRCSCPFILIYFICITLTICRICPVWFSLVFHCCNCSVVCAYSPAYLAF